MKRKTILIASVFLVLSLAGWVAAKNSCSVGATTFKEHYARVDMPETMRSTKFQGIKNGEAVIEVRRMSFLNRKRWKTRRIAVKLDDLDPAFRGEVEKAAATRPAASR